MSGHPLRPLFEPRSVAVVGASVDREKRGHQVVAALQRSGFPGPVIPVNPRGGEILGIPVVRSIGEVDEPPELVYVATPAATVPDVIAACGAAGVKGAIVPAVGFRESGPEGAELERRVAVAARETGIRVVGPNTSGLLNTHARLHMVGGEPLEPGVIAIVSQSGNIALDLMTAAAERPVGVSIYIGPGNECDVGFHEILDFLGRHEPTRAIVLYVEGLKDGRALYETARAVVADKPVVVLKGGRSEDGVRSARSHTGAVAGAYEVFRAAARQSGMIEVEASDELFAVGEALALRPAPRFDTGSGGWQAGAPDGGSGFVVLSDGGGHATLAADRFAASGVPLARLGSGTRAALRELLGPASSVTNPVDAAGAPDRSPSVLVRAVEVAAADPACAGILVTGLFGGYAIRFASSLAEEEMAAANGIARAVAEAGVPIVVHSLYERRDPAPLRRLRERGVPVHGSLEIAATCCAALVRRGRGPAPRSWAPVSGPAPPESRAALERVDEASGGWLSEVEARAIVAARGVPVIPGVHCRTESEVPAAIGDLGGGGPWVVKAVSAALPHKTEAGAVRLALSTSDEVVVAFRECVDRAARAARAVGAGHVEGALVCEMLTPPLAELLIGARHDPSFGPILTVGFGGIDVEIEPDVAIRLLPVDGEDVAVMIAELRGAQLLTGHRGRPGIDVGRVVGAALAVGDILLADPSLAEIELNPIFAYRDRVVAVDAVARRRSRPEGASAEAC